jgi:hypothetical protein
MASSYDPSVRGNDSEGIGLGSILLVLFLAALLGGGVFLYQQQRLATLAQLQAQRMAARMEAERARAAVEAAQAAGIDLDDEAISRADSAAGGKPDAPLERLREENDRLRDEVAELQRQLAEARGEVGADAGSP